MKKIFFFTSFLGLIAVSTYSCNKQVNDDRLTLSSLKEQNDNINSKNNSKILLFGTVDPSNPANTFDIYGNDHNERLIEAFTLGGMNVNSTMTDFYDYFQIASDDRIRLDNDRPNYNVSSDLYSPAFTEMMQSKPQIAYYAESIKSIMIDKTLDLQSKVSSIISFEASFNYNNGVTVNEANILKLSSSIARFSLCLWAPIAEGGSGFYDELNDPMKIDWWEVGVGDFFSACTAAFTTANPFVALGWGCVSSATGVYIHYVH